MIEIKKGRKSFLEFLNRELPALGLSHWYTTGGGYDLDAVSHTIGKLVGKERHFLFFTWTSTRMVAVASVIAEPDSPIKRGAKNAFVIRVEDPRELPAIQALAEKFEKEDFGMKAEIIY